MGEEPENPVGSVQELLATVLHEVRTPLACLTTTVDVLVGSFVELPPDEALALLRRMQRSTSWLQNLIDNLTVAAQVESRQLHLRVEVVALRECLDNCLAMVTPLLERAGQSVEVGGDLDARVVGDPRRIEQILVNLIMNASKYSDSEDPIEVRLEACGSDVRFAVIDQGPGIDPSEHQRIFQRYVRGEAAEESGATGLGLGLHIVKTLVERQGGTVGVTSTPGQGATFWFNLPTSPACVGEFSPLPRRRGAAPSRGRAPRSPRLQAGHVLGA